MGLKVIDGTPTAISKHLRERKIISSKEIHQIIERVMKKRYGYYIETKREIRELILEALEDKDKLNITKE